MADESPGTASPSVIPFHYIKSPLFRVIHVDGMIGNITPSGNVHCALYSERPAIPQRMDHRLGVDGTIGMEIATTEGKTGIVRELDVDLMMSKAVVVNIRDWFTRVLADYEEYERVAKEMAERQSGNAPDA